MDYRPYATIYDSEYADYTEDVQFYLRWAKRCPAPALELGCGTGRILLPLARAGCKVLGLDNCAAMLELARAKVQESPPEVARRLELVEGDMREFELGREFGLIYMPFREFMHLTKEEDQLACLDSCHRHLRSDGTLLINLYNMDLVTLAQQRSHDVPLCRQRGGDFLDPKTGQKVFLTSSSMFRVEDQTLLEERFYDRVDENGIVVERRVVVLEQRWFFRWEMQHLLHRANFRVEAVLGGFRGQPLSFGSEMIFVCRPASLSELQQELEWLENKVARYS